MCHFREFHHQTINAKSIFNGSKLMKKFKDLTNRHILLNTQVSQSYLRYSYQSSLWRY